MKKSKKQQVNSDANCFMFPHKHLKDIHVCIYTEYHVPLICKIVHTYAGICKLDNWYKESNLFAQNHAYVRIYVRICEPSYTYHNNICIHV